MAKANSLKLKINIPATHFEDLCGQIGYGKLCWETYGRYITDETDAQISINVQGAKKR